jgi:hypothetical protein
MSIAIRRRSKSSNHFLEAFIEKFPKEPLGAPFRLKIDRFLVLLGLLVLNVPPPPPLPPFRSFPAIMFDMVLVPPESKPPRPSAPLVSPFLPKIFVAEAVFKAAFLAI